MTNHNNTRPQPEQKPPRWRSWSNLEVWILSERYSREPVIAVAKRLGRTKGSVMKKAEMLRLRAFNQPFARTRKTGGRYSAVPTKDPGFDKVTRLAVCARWVA